MAAGPELLGAVGIGWSIRVIASALAATQVMLALGAWLTRLPAVVSAAGAAVTGLLLTTALLTSAPLLQQWTGMCILLGALFAVCALVNRDAIVAALIGVTAGTLLGLSQAPATTPLDRLGLSVEASYEGETVQPAWLRTDRALTVAAINIAVAGCLILGGDGRQRRLLRGRYAALDRILRGAGQLAESQSALALVALADPSWNLIGVGVIEWELLRIIAVRAPVGSGTWRNFVQGLRDVSISLFHAGNPLARAARVAQRAEITSCAQLVDGMFHEFSGTEQAQASTADARGWAVPFGNPVVRGVVFALSAEEKADFKWLNDLAGALSILGVGTRTGLARPSAVGK
jgi:hypothetical protein